MTTKKLTISIICAAMMFLSMNTTVISSTDSTSESDHIEWSQTKIADAPAYAAKINNNNDKIQTLEHDMNVKTSNISVSCFKVTWDAIDGHEYEISCANPGDVKTQYADNIHCEIRENGLCYITGLRESTAYVVTIHDKTSNKSEEILSITNHVTILEEYDYISGNTDCFAYEAASGLTRNPSKSAIAGAIIDPVTHTGIMRNEYGDYCVAMGLYFGECGDRFLVELENGVQFTVKICDSKGYGSDGEGKYHTFGADGSGKCVIEFIHGGYVPYEIRQSGNYSTLDWNGLKLDKIKYIYKIETERSHFTQY